MHMVFPMIGIVKKARDTGSWPNTSRHNARDAPSYGHTHKIAKQPQLRLQAKTGQMTEQTQRQEGRPDRHWWLSLSFWRRSSADLEVCRRPLSVRIAATTFRIDDPDSSVPHAWPAGILKS
jgi:hypothetical protein